MSVKPPERGGPPRLSHAALEALAEKYATLEALRRRRDRQDPHPPREELRRLSALYPGCLRELDRHTADALAAKQAAARRAMSTTTALEPEVAPSGASSSTSVALPPELAWLAWIHRYHALVRAELLAAERAREHRAPPGDHEPPLEATPASATDERERRGPSGRALSTLARETGVSASALCEALFPPRRRAG